MSHKGFTIPFFINTIKALPAKAFTVENFYSALAPRAGYNAKKSIALDILLSDGGWEVTLELVRGKTPRAKKLGATAKTRLIKALKNVKTKGNIFA